MILKHKKFDKSEKVIRSVVDNCNKNYKSIDGCIEVFHNGREQGHILKLYNKMNPEEDICIWVFVPHSQKEHNTMDVVISEQKNCSATNNWNDIAYKNMTSFTKPKALELQYEVSKYICDEIKESLKNRIYDFDNERSVKI